MTYQRVEVLTGTERRRNYTPAEKARMVEAAFRPGVVVTDAARRLGVHESLLYRWRRLMMAAGPTEFVAVTITAEPEDAVPPAPDPAPPPPASTSLSIPAPPSPAPLAGTRAAVEIALPGGARVRLEGAVDPALATAVLVALAPARQAS